VFGPIIEAAVLEEEEAINIVRIEIDEAECAELASRYQVPAQAIRQTLRVDYEFTDLYRVSSGISGKGGVEG
jgi:hypothetical protein